MFLRCYEKGKLELSRGGVWSAPISLDWCRLEVEVKPPNKAAKVAASRLDPLGFWGFSGWSRDVLFQATGLDVQRMHMTTRKESDARRAIRHMAVQYKKAIQAFIAEERGNDLALIRYIREVWGSQARPRGDGLISSCIF